MAYKIILEPQKSPGLLSLNEFYLRFWNNSIHKISRCQYSYISVQLTEFLHMEITNLSFKIQLDCNLLCYAFQVPSKLNESSPSLSNLSIRTPSFHLSPQNLSKNLAIGNSQKFLTGLFLKWIALRVIIYSIRIHIQLTLENHRFELWGTTYMWMVFNKYLQYYQCIFSSLLLTFSFSLAYFTVRTQYIIHTT